jgi:hypothetical protein
MGESPKAGETLRAGSGPVLEPPRPGPKSPPDSGPTLAGTSVSPDSPRAADDRLQAALEATSRAEASLSALMRAVEQVTSGVSGAQAANEHLATELERARELLGSTNERRLALENKVTALEAALAGSEEAVAEAQRDRTFLIEEQDRFLAALLGDHDEEIAELKREIFELRAASGQPPTAEKKTLPGIPRAAEPVDANVAMMRDEIERLRTERERSRDILRKVQTQRDEAQAQVARLVRERDEQKAEIQRLAALLEAPPELTAQLRGEDALRAHPTPAHLRGRRTDPQVWRPPPDPELSQRVTTPPPPEAFEALSQSRQSSPHLPLVRPDPEPPPAQGGPTVETPMSRPPPPALLRKQDPTRRPLGGYSLAAEEVEADRVPARPSSSKPPSR